MKYGCHDVALALQRFQSMNLNLKNFNSPLIIRYIFSCKKVNDRIHRIGQWFKNGGILIIGYEMFRTLISNIDEKEESDVTNTDKMVMDYLINPGPDVIVCIAH